MAYSFYGGREGRSFTIVKNFASINDMVTAFQQGGSYTDVNFGEYVIIDTTSKNNPENGCVYRRGYNYNEVVQNPNKENPGGGAEYVGQIVGPEGIHGTDIVEFGLDTTTQGHEYQFYYKDKEYVSDDQGIVSNKKFIDDAYLKSINRIDAAAAGTLQTWAANTNYTAGTRVLVPNKENILFQAISNGTSSSSLPDLTNAVQGTSFIDGTVIWNIISPYDLAYNSLNIHYTHGNDDNITLRVLDSVQLDTDGRLYVKYSDVNQRIYLGDNQSIKDINYQDIYTDAQSVVHKINRLYVTLNTINRDINGNIIIDTTFEFDSITGAITKYPTTDVNGNYIIYITEPIKFISSMSIGADHHLYVTYNTGEIEDAGLTGLADPRNTIIMATDDGTGQPSEGGDLIQPNGLWFVLEEVED